MNGDQSMDTDCGTNHPHLLNLTPTKQTPSPKKSPRHLMKNESPLTPATQTLNTLAGVGNEDGWNDLLYDASQLSFHPSRRCEARVDVNRNSSSLQPFVKEKEKHKENKVGEMEYIGRCCDNQYGIYHVILDGKGPFGMEIHKTVKGNAVKRMNRKMQAYQCGIRIDDIIYCPLEPRHVSSTTVNPEFCIDESTLKIASLEELEGWSKSTLRPIHLAVKRMVSATGKQATKRPLCEGKVDKDIDYRKKTRHAYASNSQDSNAVLSNSSSEKNNVAITEEKTVKSKTKKACKSCLNEADDTLHSFHSGSYQNGRRKAHELDEVLDSPAWILCSNPWGSFVGSRSFLETDFVLSCALDYQKARTIRDSKPGERFIMNPFGSKVSPYHQSHVSPKEGYSVVQLVRDRLCLKTWGFSFCRHELGGACLVTNIEAISPATAAVSIGY